MAEYDTVGEFSLKNKGGFVIKMRFKYMAPPYSGEWLESKNSDSWKPLGKTITLSPSELDVPNMSKVRLHVNIKSGADTEAKEDFLFDETSTKTAIYHVKGTISNAEVILDRIDV